MTAQELFAFFNSNSTVYNGHTLIEWARIGSVPDIRNILFDIGNWGNSYSVPVDSVAPGDIWASFMTLDTWPTVASSVKDDIGRVVRENPFPIGDSKYFAAVEAAITQAYPTLLSAWSGLRFRPASYGEKFGVTDELISQVVGMVAG